MLDTFRLKYVDVQQHNLWTSIKDDLNSSGENL